MSAFYPDIHLARLKEAFTRLRHELIVERVPMTAEYAVTREPVPYAQREALDFRPITTGESWGTLWDCGWFRVRGEVPGAWRGADVVLNLDFTGEALVYDAAGCPKSSLTTGSVFDAAYNKDILHVLRGCSGGETFDLWVETGANGLFGGVLAPDPNWIEDGSDIHGTYPATVRQLSVCRFDTEKWQLWLDLDVIIDLVEALPAGTARRIQVLRMASRALDALPPERGGASAVREALRAIFELGSDPATVDVHGVGHAHIDTAWLWPIRETIRKVGRTFASQVDLIRRYPEYVFGASQPQLYAFCKTHYPALYASVRQAVADGRWELQGAMWVEADCNIPSGESLLRQLIHGMNFYRDEFGVVVRNVWLPDVFGYSGNLPQLMRHAGVAYFLTQKISWNRYNKFPHNTFVWRGIDGSEVLAHFPPEDDYNSQVRPGQLKKHERNNAEAGLINDAICLFGIGDGGGGPKEEHIERGLRCRDLNGCPRFHFGFAQPALERMNASRPELSTWTGELYFEMHRGTLTSQATIKRWNRRAEEALRAAEMLCATAGLDRYPADAFDEMWKTLLCSQFHDIIPGSSIHRVYAEAVPELQAIVARCKTLQDEAAAVFLDPSASSAVYFNPSSTPFSGAIRLPEGWKSGSVDGQALVVQREADDYLAWLEVPAGGFVTVAFSKQEPAGAATAGVSGDVVLENDSVRYVFDERMRLVSCHDKTLGMEMIPEGQAGNAIALYDDHPTVYDAWDIESYVLDMQTAVPEMLSIETIRGPVRSGIMAFMKLGGSTFMQTAWLGRTGARLDFETSVDWRERHKLARVTFPVAVHADEARYEIQYGTMARATHDNTKWQAAQFEGVGHRYADLSEPGYGCALLNDSKYGYCVKDGVMALSLLRAPTHPDPICDIGHHHFIYSFLPHAGALAASDTVAANAAMINQGLVCLEGREAGAPARLPVSFDGEGVEVAVIKRAERENSLIVRLVERRGRRATGVLRAVFEDAAWVPCSATEWEETGASMPTPATLTFRPYEIKTLKLRG